jgi:hypothetical protein
MESPWSDPRYDTLTAAIWIAVGVPGYSGAAKARRAEVLDERFGADGWRYAHVVRGDVVSFEVAIAEYEESYRQYLRSHPSVVALLATVCGNVYDDQPGNVFDHDYVQPHTAMNHYQDIAVRRVIAELADDHRWPDVSPAGAGEFVDLVDLTTGAVHRAPRAKGMQGGALMQIRDARSAGYLLNPALVPVHDPALITTLPAISEWYHREGCAHLSVEAFWQMSKIIEVRYDRFLALGDARDHPLDGL